MDRGESVVGSCGNSKCTTRFHAMEGKCALSTAEHSSTVTREGVQQSRAGEGQRR